MTPARFVAQVRHLHDVGYTGVRFSDLAHRPDDGGIVAITFDDAFSSEWVEAYRMTAQEVRLRRAVAKAAETDS